MEIICNTGGGGGLIALFVYEIYISPYAGFTSPVAIGVLSGMTLLILSLVYGCYSTLTNERFSNVYLFFRRKSLQVKNIEGIYYPEWAIGMNIHSFYVIGKSDKGKKISIELNNSLYTKKTLARLVNDLLKINSSITLDDETKELLKQYS